MAKEKQVSDEMLMKALGDLEEHALESGDEQDEVAEESVEEPVVAKSKKKAMPPPAKDDESSDDEDEESSDEESVDKGLEGKKHAGADDDLPDDTDEANGGLSQHDSDDPSNFETRRSNNDPTKSKKSMKSLVRSDKEFAKAFEVSSFIESLTNANVESVDDLRKSLLNFVAEDRAWKSKMQTAIIAIGNHMLGLNKSVENLGEQPVVARPRALLAKSDVVERFGDGGEQQRPQYSKEQTLEALTDLVMKGKMHAIVVSEYETSGHVPPMHVQAVSAHLKQMFG